MLICITVELKCLFEPFKSIKLLTEEAGNTRISSVAGVQIHFMGVQSGWCDSQVATQSVDILHQCHIHF